MEVETRYDVDYHTGRVNTFILGDSKLILRVISDETARLDKNKLPLWDIFITTTGETPKNILENTFFSEFRSETYAVDSHKDIRPQTNFYGNSAIGVPVQHKEYVNRVVEALESL